MRPDSIGRPVEPRHVVDARVRRQLDLHGPEIVAELQQQIDLGLIGGAEEVRLEAAVPLLQERYDLLDNEALPACSDPRLVESDFGSVTPGSAWSSPVSRQYTLGLLTSRLPILAW